MKKFLSVICFILTAFVSKAQTNSNRQLPPIRITNAVTNAKNIKATLPVKTATDNIKTGTANRSQSTMPIKTSNNNVLSAAKQSQSRFQQTASSQAIQINSTSPKVITPTPRTFLKTNPAQNIGNIPVQ